MYTYAHFSGLTWNRCAFIGVDILFGLALRYLGTARIVAELLDGYSFAVTRHTRNLTLFLMDAPADLKLNDQAMAFYGNVIMLVLDVFQDFRSTQFSVDRLEVLVSMVLCTGLVCTSAVCVDIMRVFALPVTIAHRLNTRLWRSRHVVSALFSLLFRGKKYNVRRKRYDSIDVDYLQSAVCAYLFAISVFLVPTLLVTKVAFGFAYCVMYVVMAPFVLVASIRHMRIHIRRTTTMDVVHHAPAVVDLRVRVLTDWTRTLSSLRIVA